MAIVNGYAAVQDIRDQLSDEGSKLSDTLLERSISATSRAVDKHCGRRFWQDATASARLYNAVCYDSLDVHDISTQTGLIVETDAHNTGDWVVVDATTYHLEPLNADADMNAYAWWTVVSDSGAGFPVSRTPLVRVTAQWGWSEIPNEVTEATILKAIALFKRKDAPFGIAGFNDFGPVRLSRSDPDVTNLLRPYKKPVIA